MRWVGAVALLAACTEYGLSGEEKPEVEVLDTAPPVLAKRLEVVPPVSDFGAVAVGDRRESAAVVTNVGDLPVTVASISLIDAERAFELILSLIHI